MLNIKKYIILFRRILIGLIMVMLSINMVQAQVGLHLSSDPLLINGQLSFDGIILQVQNNSNFNGEVVVHINADRFQKNRIATSQVLTIREVEHSFNLQDIFTDPNIKWPEGKPGTICFQIVSNKQNIPLGFTCSELIQIKNNIPENNKKGSSFINADIIYELQAFPFGNTPDNQLLDYSGTLRVKEIPVRFQGFFQTRKDPYLDNDLSGFSIFFDVNQWKTNIKKKTETVFQKERDSLLQDFPDYRSMAAKGAYVKRLSESPEVLKELSSIDSLSALANTLGLSSYDKLERYQDSLQLQLDQYEEAMVEEVDSIENASQLDSLKKKTDQLRKRIEQAEELRKNYSKKEAYNHLFANGKNSQQYLQKADSITSTFDQEYQEILTQPKKLNQYLRQHELGRKYMHVLNYISEFRTGIIRPQYSQLVLQNSSIKGISTGFEFGKWDIAGFRGRINNSDLNLRPDSLSRETNKITGAQLGYHKTEKAKHDVFVIAANRLPFFGPRMNQTIIGQTSTYQVDDRNKLAVEIAWSLNKTENTELISDTRKWERLIRTIASASTYQGKSENGKLNWRAELEYFGPEYLDINNPFLVNNVIDFSSAIQYSLFKELHLGWNALYSKGNIWETEDTERRQLFSQGLTTSFFHNDWPSMQYVFNRSSTKGEDYILKSLFQNVNINKAYTVGNTKGQSMANWTNLKNEAGLDSLNQQLMTFYFSQEISLSEKMRLTAAFNYLQLDQFQSSEQDLTYELKMPMRFKHINLDPGIKWIRNKRVNQFGWSINVSSSISKNISLNVFANSHWLNSTIDEFGVITNEYTPRINVRINYRF